MSEYPDAPRRWRTWLEICDVVAARRETDFRLKRDMQRVRDRVNADYVIPLYDVAGQPLVASLAPQIVADAIDQGAQRASGTHPSIYVPAKNAVDLNMKRAAKRRDTLYATWTDNRMGLMLHRAYRHLYGYGNTAFVATPDVQNGRVGIELRDPLTAYPEPRSPEDMTLPENGAFVYGRSPDYMAACYPVDANGDDLRGYWISAAAAGSLIDVLEWYDEDQIAVGVLGSNRDRNRTTSSPLVTGGRLLVQVANRSGVCPIVCPQAVTLDRIAAAVSRVVPITDLLDKFMALESIAAEKNVFPDRYAVGTENKMPQIVTGPWKDGRTGEMNLLLDVSKVGELSSAPGEGAFRMLGLLERNARGSGGAPALFGGELTGSLRSGQTVNALGAFAVDPRVAESQEVMSAWLSVLNVAILETYKGWYGARQFSMWSGRPADSTKTEFTPNDDFDDTANVVAYAFPGADVSSITVALGQAVGAKLLSLQTARVKHPFVDQPEFEDRRVQIEALDEALLTSMQTQAAQGALPAIDLANIEEFIAKGDTLSQAVIKAQKLAQERQAKAAQPPPPDAGMAAPPETMPGMANPGAGAEAQPEAIPAPGQAVQNIRALQLAYKSSPGPPVRSA